MKNNQQSIIDKMMELVKKGMKKNDAVSTALGVPVAPTVNKPKPKDSK